MLAPIKRVQLAAHFVAAGKFQQAIPSHHGSGNYMTRNDGQPGEMAFGGRSFPGPPADRIYFYPDDPNVVEQVDALRVYYVNDKVVGREDLRRPIPLLTRIKQAIGW
jgi:hypothetical protein